MKCNIVSPVSCTYQDDWTALVICMRWSNWCNEAHVFPWEAKQSLQPHKKFPAFYGNKMFTGARHKSENTARWIQATCWDCFFHVPPIRPSSPRSPNSFQPFWFSSFPIFWRKFLMYFSSVAFVLHALLFSYWILSPSYLIDSTQCGASYCLIFYFRFVTVYNIPLKIVFLRTLPVCVLVS